MPEGKSRSRKKKKTTATQRKVAAAFHETKHNEPAIVRHTRRKYGAARAKAQKTRISLEKAREKGARIPPPPGEPPRPRTRRRTASRTRSR